MLMRSAAISSGHRRRSGKLYQNSLSEFSLPSHSRNRLQRAMAVGNESQSCSETQLALLQHAILRIRKTNNFTDLSSPRPRESTPRSTARLVRDTLPPRTRGVQGFVLSRNSTTTSHQNFALASERPSFSPTNSPQFRTYHVVSLHLQEPERTGYFRILYCNASFFDFLP